ncbi:hypothetical protein B0H19DRAFT_1079606 [Mycena capillaripes]|nr:hypothetical protein B0H19DRAFT_1079606 [Mycena capillaripes]
MWAPLEIVRCYCGNCRSLSEPARKPAFQERYRHEWHKMSPSTAYKWENASPIGMFLKEEKPTAKGNCKKVNTIKNGGCFPWRNSSLESRKTNARRMSQNNQIYQVSESKKKRRKCPIEAPQIQTRLQEKRDSGGKQGGCGGARKSAARD